MARELGRISLAEALELTILIARKELRRLSRVAVRWLERYLQEYEPTLSDVALAVSALSALPHEPGREAVRVLWALLGSFLGPAANSLTANYRRASGSPVCIQAGRPFSPYRGMPPNPVRSPAARLSLPDARVARFLRFAADAEALATSSAARASR